MFTRLAASRSRRWLTAAVCGANLWLPPAPTAAAAADTWCASGLGGAWDASAQVCAVSVTSHHAATMSMSVGLPSALLDNPTAGPTLQNYTRILVERWRKTGADLVRDNTAGAECTVFTSSAAVTSVVFHETFQTAGTTANNAYRTFSFDLAQGRQLQLADLFAPGVDPLTALPPVARPYLVDALDQAPPPHAPGSYPFTSDNWEPQADGSGFSGDYRAFALSADELILYLPDAPMTHENPPPRGELVWSMDGGTVIVHIPRAALASLLRPL